MCSLIPTSSASPGVELPATSLSLGPSGGPTTSLTCSLKYQPCYIPPISHPWGGLTLHLNIYHRVGLWILCFIPASQRILPWKDSSDIPPCRWKDWGSGTCRVVCPPHSTAEPRIQVFSNRLCWVATKMALTDKNNKKRQLVLARQLRVSGSVLDTLQITAHFILLTPPWESPGTAASVEIRAPILWKVTSIATWEQGNGNSQLPFTVPSSV